MANSKFEVDKFTGENDSVLWQIKMKTLLVHHGISKAIVKDGLASIKDDKQA